MCPCTATAAQKSLVRNLCHCVCRDLKTQVKMDSRKHQTTGTKSERALTTRKVLTGNLSPVSGQCTLRNLGHPSFIGRGKYLPPPIPPKDGEMIVPVHRLAEHCLHKYTYFLQRGCALKLVRREELGPQMFCHMQDAPNTLSNLMP